MSDLSKRPDGRLVPNHANIRAVLSDPFSLLPAPVRPAALRTWTCYRHLTGMESGLSIAALVAVWIDEDGLRSDDACACLSAMLRPEKVGDHKFASDLTASLAAAVGMVLKRRRTEAENEQRERDRQQAERDRATLPEGFSLSRLAESMRMD